MTRTIEAWVRPSVLVLEPYASARDDFKGTAEVYLDANESPFGSLNRYPDPNQSVLKERLSEIKRVPSSHIFIGNGSDEVIDLVFRVFCRPGIDSVVVCPPTYGMYSVSAAINEVGVLSVPLLSDFQLDVEGILAYAGDETAKVIFICSPNNPTGNLMDIEDVTTVLEQFDGVVVIDEAYIDFADKASLIRQIESYPNLLICQTFSKAWGLAGVRVGAAYADPALIALLTKVKPPYNVSTLNQEAVITALDDRAKATQLTSIIQERSRLQQALGRVPGVKKVYPSDSNFLLIEVGDADRVYIAMSRRGIIVRNRSIHVPNCLRVTVGTAVQNDLLLKTLGAVLIEGG